jgi:anti-sigma factor RsiW
MLESSERITCQELTELVNDFVEGLLPSHELALFEQHLNFCDGCDWYVEQIRTTIAATGRITEADVPPRIRNQLLTAFRRERREA